jgi:hypothetical protein
MCAAAIGSAGPLRGQKRHPEGVSSTSASALQTDIVSAANQVQKVPTEVIRSRERFDIRRHVGNSCDPVVRVAAFKNPNAAVWSRPLIILPRTKRLFASEPLRTNLSRQYSLQRFGRNLLRPHLGAEKNRHDSQE